MLDWPSGRNSGRDQTIRFWAERSPSFYWEAFALTAIVMAPSAILSPRIFLAGLAAAGLVSLLNSYRFRFALTATHLRYRPSILVPELWLPLSQIVQARVDQADSGRTPWDQEVGTLVVVLASGHHFRVAGILDPREAAEAVWLLTSEAENDRIGRETVVTLARPTSPGLPGTRKPGTGRERRR